ncbi:MAG TPA: hypothetical protein VJT14_13865, partial [Candidatus Dormibacteraeota bacterium]|nr:hypothetical protein [Candidatus Dormibacteraeota bacterium]
RNAVEAARSRTAWSKTTAHNRAQVLYYMAENLSVCCPTCWTWSQPRDGKTCTKCGTPLIFADGRRVDGIVRAETTAPPPRSPALNQARVPSVIPSPHPSSDAAASTGWFGLDGVNWVLVSRCITAGYSSFIVVALLALGFLFRGSTSLFTAAFEELLQQFIAVAVLAVIGLCALVVWLTKFVVARVGFGLIATVVVLSCFSSMAQASAGQGLPFTILNLVVALAYGLALSLSIISPVSRR